MEREIFNEGTQARSQRLADELSARLAEGGLKFVQMEWPDINGSLRGKIKPLRGGLSPAGTGVAAVVMSVRGADQVSLDTPWSSVRNGYPKMTAVPDYATLVPLSWTGDTAAVLCDLYMNDGTPCPLDGRLILKDVVDKYEAIGLTPRVATEFEAYLFNEDDGAIREGRFRGLRPFGRGRDFYSLSRFPSFMGFAKEFITRMEAANIEVEAFHTEYGGGQFEWALHHAPALKSADDAARTKLYLKQLADEFHLVACFMAVVFPETGDSGSGAHQHFSLWAEGRNVFWDSRAQGLSELGRKFAGGVLATMREFHVLFRPWVTSHRRMNRMAWNPENASWGVENHTAAVRVVHGSVPSEFTRLEHRTPGPDVNPYLSVAAILYGGLHGIQNNLEPGAYSAGDAMQEERWDLLPRSLPESIEVFQGSKLAREFLGDQFVEHYARVKRDEWEDYAAWLGEQPVERDSIVTDWEFNRYFLWA